LLAILIILFLPVLTCKNFAPDSDNDPDRVTYTDVVYSPDGRSVTIYLDGTTVPVTNRQSRALSKDLAIAGHDFFEVAFYYQVGAAPSSSDVIARASWELRTQAHVSGVYGKGVGEGDIDYAETAVRRNEETTVEETVNEIIGYDPETGTPIYGDVIHYIVTNIIVNNLDEGEGAAILFVGKKTDKTLLGVGRLTKVNGVDGTVINSATTSVTFEVAPLECGVDDTGLLRDDRTSFQTNYSGSDVTLANTNRQTVTKDGKQFYMYKLREISSGGSNITSGWYYFRTYGKPIDDYVNGIIVSGNGVYEKKQPRYPMPNGQFQYFSVMLDDKTIIEPTNNTTGGIPFVNPIKVTFNTMHTEPGSEFAFVFQVPVSPLWLDANSGKWYIRASYDSYWLDLDDGGLRITKGAGGAVLISTGTVAEISAYMIRILAPPTKYLYPYHLENANPEPNPNRKFDYTGMVVELLYANGTSFNPRRYINPSELTYELGQTEIGQGEFMSLTMFGIQTVNVTYYHSSGVPLKDSFIIICDNSTHQYTDIPDWNRIVIDNNALNYNNLQGYLNTRLNLASTTSSVFVIILAESFDFGNNFELQYSGSNSPYLLIFVSGKPGADAVTPAAYDPNFKVAVGRTSGTMSNGVFRSWGTANAFYFGKWPFNEELRGWGRGTENNILANERVYTYIEYVGPSSTPVHKTYDYTFNAYGSRSNLSAPPPGVNPQATGNTNSYFLRDGHSGRMWNTTVDSDLSIYNRIWLN